MAQHKVVITIDGEKTPEFAVSARDCADLKAYYPNYIKRLAADKIRKQKRKLLDKTMITVEGIKDQLKLADVVEMLGLAEEKKRGRKKGRVTRIFTPKQRERRKAIKLAAKINPSKKRLNPEETKRFTKKAKELEKSEAAMEKALAALRRHEKK